MLLNVSSEDILTLESSIVFALLTAGSCPSRHDYPRRKDYFAYSQAAVQFLLSRFLRDRWQG